MTPERLAEIRSRRIGKSRSFNRNAALLEAEVDDCIAHIDQLERERAESPYNLSLSVRVHELGMEVEQLREALAAATKRADALLAVVRRHERDTRGRCPDCSWAAPGHADNCPLAAALRMGL